MQKQCYLCILSIEITPLHNLFNCPEAELNKSSQSDDHELNNDLLDLQTIACYNHLLSPHTCIEVFSNGLVFF